MAQKKPLRQKDEHQGNGEDAGFFFLGRANVDSYPGGCVHVRVDGSAVPCNKEGSVLLDTLSAGGLDAFVRHLRSCTNAETFCLTLGTLTQSRNLFILPVDDGWLVFGSDFPLERTLRKALTESRQRYRDMVELSADFVWEVDAEGRFAFISAQGFLGHPATQVIGKKPEDFITGWNKGRSGSVFLTQEKVRNVMLTALSRTGRVLHLVVSAKPLVDAEGRWCGARGICRDITGEKQAETLLLIKNQLALTIRDITDPKTMLKVAAEKIAHALGARGSQIFFHNAQDNRGFTLKASHGRPGRAEEVLAALQDKEIVRECVQGWHVLAVHCFSHQQVNGALCIWRHENDSPWTEEDAELLASIANHVGIANEQVAVHEHMLHLSHTDELTGLYNRRAFFEELERSLRQLQRAKKSGALIYVDLDNFKLVNDTHGHMSGDQVLQQVSGILLNNSRPDDLLGRLGGDEFALWMNGAGKQTAASRCEALLKEVEHMGYLSGREGSPFGFSLGVAVFEPESGESLTELIARADAAMYSVKKNGKGGMRTAPESESSYFSDFASGL